MNLITKFIKILFIIYILSIFGSISNASIFKFKFENFEKAHKLYKTDPVEAHKIIDDLINHYEKKLPKDYPWLGNAYGDKAQFLFDEGDIKKSTEFREKSCSQFQRKYKKQKKNDGDGSLLHCYYMLSLAYNDLKLFKKSIAVATKAISIFEKYDNYRVNEFHDLTQFNYQIFQRARTYESDFQYDNSIRDYERIFKLKKNPDKRNAQEIKNYISAASSLRYIYSKKGDSINELKYLKIYYDSVYKFAGNDPHMTSLVNVSMGNYFNSVDNSESAIKHFDEVISITNATLKNSKLSYKDRSNFISNKMTAMVGKNTALNRIDPDNERKKNLALKLIEMNSEFELLNKRTDGYEYLVDYYFDTEDYKNVKLTYQKIYKLLDQQVVEAKKLETVSLRDQWVGFIVSDIRRTKFDEGFNYVVLNRFNEAINIADQLKKYETKDEGAGEIYFKVALLNLYGLSHSGLGDHKKSITNYLEALEVLNKSFEKDYDQENDILNNLALAYLNTGERELAVKYMSEVGKREEKSNRPDIFKVNTYSNLAVIIPDRKIAKEYAIKSYKVYMNNKEQFRNSMGFINTVSILSEFYVAEKNYSEAEKVIMSGYEYAKVNYQKNILGFKDYLYLYGDIAGLKNKDFDTCINYSKIIIDELIKVDSTSQQLIKPHLLKNACHSLKGEKDLGYDDLFKAMLIILQEFDRNNFSLNFEVNKLVKANRESIELFISRTIINLQKNPNLLKKYSGVNFLDVAFAMQQIIKTNELNVNLSQAISRELTSDGQVSNKVKKYSSLLIERQGLLKLASLDDKNIKKNNTKIKDINKDIKSLKKQILKEYPEFMKNFASQTAIGSKLPPNIPENEALIQFSIGRFQSFATVITKENYFITHLQRKKPGINLEKKWDLTDRKKVSNLVKEIRKSLQLVNGEPTNFDLENSSLLFEMLFTESLLDKIKEKKKLVIIPDRSLYGLPFELLYDKKNKKWFVEKFAVSVSPSAYSYVALNLDKKIPFNSTNSFAGFGNPKIQDVKVAKNSELKKVELEFSKVLTRGGAVNLKYLKLFPELPETEDELRKISTKFDSNSKLYLREDFNENQIKTTDFRKFKVVSFATHALVVGEIEGLAEPAIVLSVPDKASRDNDGLLTASEIVKLDLSTDLVILSACNTASSSGKTNSEALSGLANSFFYSGTKSLLVTHWSIISDTSVQLISDTFDFLDEANGDLSLALSNAKIKMLKENKTEHPIYWAPYTLVGRSKI